MTIGHLIYDLRSLKNKLMTKKSASTRARNQDAKLARRQDILDSSLTLFRQSDLDSISMDAIAKKSKLAKGTLYIYFGTKEEVFLSLLEQELSQWISAVRESLQNLDQPLPAFAFARALTETLEAQPELPRLFSLLHNVLEQNLSDEIALKFKLELKRQLSDAAEIVAGKTPALNPQTAFPFLMKAYAVLVGLYQVANPSPRMRKILENPELQIFQIHFFEQLAEVLSTLLIGMEEIENQKTRNFHLFKNY